MAHALAVLGSWCVPRAEAANSSRQVGKDAVTRAAICFAVTLVCDGVFMRLHVCSLPGRKEGTAVCSHAERP
jgi:hypothetical protein